MKLRIRCMLTWSHSCFRDEHFFLSENLHLIEMCLKTWIRINNKVYIKKNTTSESEILWTPIFTYDLLLNCPYFFPVLFCLSQLLALIANEYVIVSIELNIIRKKQKIHLIRHMVNSLTEVFLCICNYSSTNWFLNNNSIAHPNIHSQIK